MYRRPLKGWIKHLDFIIIDLVCLQAAFVLAFWYRFGVGANPYEQAIYSNIIFVLSLIDILVAVVFSSYSGVLKKGYMRLLFACGKHSFIVLATATVYLFSTRTGDAYSRLTIAFTAVFHLALTYVADIIYKKLRWGRGVQKRSMLVISTEAEAPGAVESLKKDKSGTIDVVGIAVLDRDMMGQLIGGVHVVANSTNVEDIVCREWVDEVYVRLPQSEKMSDDVYHALREMGMTIHIDAAAFENLKGSEFVLEKIGGGMVLTTSMKMPPRWQLAAKRLLDILGGVVGTILTLLIAIFIAPFIWAKSPGPLFFAQERIGKNGKRFRMYKFRSMYMDAEERKAALVKASGLEDQMMFKLEDDPRIIGSEKKDKNGKPKGIGNFIRNTSLDEFPQFWNVLKGDMSLVGTRPPTIDEWERYDLHHRVRMSTKPGITGMWQVSGRSDITDFEEVVRLDKEYIENWSIGLDFKILFKTIKVVLMGKGAK